jgi:hypothetical protein
MRIWSRYRCKVRWPAVLLLIAVIMAGCAGIEPFEPRNHREEGPEKGLFTGSEGEFVILRKADEPEKDSEDKKSPKEAGSAVKPEADSGQSGNVDEPPGDTP